MRNNYNDDLEKELAGQIPEFNEPEVEDQSEEVIEENVEEKQPEPKKDPYESGSLLGTKISVNRKEDRYNKEETQDYVNRHHISRIGESINGNADIRAGWMIVNKDLLGERAVFYPDEWEFRIRPATVEAIRNWSTIDDENANSVNNVFNEVMKSCFSIMTPTGPLPWYNINAWDRFFFILLIREYTFKKGETLIQYTEDCPNCDNPVTFTLTSTNLMFDMPDPEVMPMYDRASRTWIIDPQEYGLPIEEPIKLWLPTLEKDINIRQWLTLRYQENPNKNFDPVFIKFMPWFMPKVSKDDTIAQRQIKEFRMKFNSWDIDTFEFMNDVITNIMVTPLTKLSQVCPVCGEEVTSQVRFPNGTSALFNISSKYGKFGKK